MYVEARGRAGSGALREPCERRGHHAVAAECGGDRVSYAAIVSRATWQAGSALAEASSLLNPWQDRRPAAAATV
jgi:predicted deacylase